MTSRNKRTFAYYSIRTESIDPQNIALLMLIKNAVKPKRKSKALELLSAAMFEPRVAKYFEILSRTD